VTDYKKYALGQLENFLYDAMSAEATPQEIYDTIRDAVQDNLNVYTKSADQARKLLSLLNGHRPVDFGGWEIELQYTDKEIEEMCAAAELEQDLRNVGGFLKQDRDSNFPGENTVKDNVKKWVLPVEDDGPSGEYFITFPDDLLEAANLKEGDQIRWINNNNGSFTMTKVTKPLGMDEC
jgi:hypothetical protein